MAKRKRKTFTPEFKAKVVLEALHKDTSQAELCQRHNISEEQLSEWKQQLLENATSSSVRFLTFLLWKRFLFRLTRRLNGRSPKKIREIRVIRDNPRFGEKMKNVTLFTKLFFVQQRIATEKHPRNPRHQWVLNRNAHKNPNLKML